MERGTGKTTKLLKATPVGGVFIVQNQHMVGYVKQWIRNNGREDDDIKVISVTALNQLRGFKPAPITIDHCVPETLHLLSEEEREALTVACYMAPLTIACDIEGDIITSWID